MRRVGAPFELFDNREKHQEQIISVSARLFAIEGYDTVTVRRISQESGVTPQQIYDCFENKQVLLGAVLDKTAAILQGYFQALVRECEGKDTYREVLDMLYVELHNITNELVYYGLCLAHQMQFVNERAFRIYNEDFLVGNIHTVRQILERLVERGLCASLNTLAVASMICSSVIVGNDVRVGQFAGRGPDLDLDACYAAQEEFLLEVGAG